MLKYPGKVTEVPPLRAFFKGTAFVIGVVVVFFSASFLVACGPGESTVTGSPGVDEVWIVNGSFIPAKITVHLDTSETTVTWTNKDRKTYTIVSDTPGLFSKTLSPGGSFSFTFPEHGNFRYHANAKMNGLVFVEQQKGEDCITCHDVENP